MENTILKLRGMSCASCARSVEKAISSVPGVSECIVNFGAEQATIEYDPGKTDLQVIQNVVCEAGYSAYPLQQQNRLVEDDVEKRVRSQMLCVCGTFEQKLLREVKDPWWKMASPCQNGKGVVLEPPFRTLTVAHE